MSRPMVILAGGLGTRLGEITRAIPKALVEVNGEPFLAHQLRLLKIQGIERVVMCVSHLGHMIRDFAGDGSAFGIHVEYAFDGSVLRGTAGAIRHALPMLGDSFFVLYGDSYLPCDIQAVGQGFDTCGKLGLMTVHRNDDHWDSSNVEFADGKILAYDKRARTQRMHFIDYGLGAFRQAAFNSIQPGEPYDLAQLYQDLLARDELCAWEVPQRFYEIGSVDGLNDLARYLSLRTNQT